MYPNTPRTHLLQHLVPEVMPRLRHIPNQQGLPPFHRIIVPPVTAQSNTIELHDVAAGCGHCDMQIGGVVVIAAETQRIKNIYIPAITQILVAN